MSGDNGHQANTVHVFDSYCHSNNTFTKSIHSITDRLARESNRTENTHVTRLDELGLASHGSSVTQQFPSNLIQYRHNAWSRRGLNFCLRSLCEPLSATTRTLTTSDCPIACTVCIIHNIETLEEGGLCPTCSPERNFSTHTVRHGQKEKRSLFKAPFSGESEKGMSLSGGGGRYTFSAKWWSLGFKSFY